MSDLHHGLGHHRPFVTRMPVTGSNWAEQNTVYAFNPDRTQAYWYDSAHSQLHSIPQAFKTPQFADLVRDPSNPFMQHAQMAPVFAQAATLEVGLFSAGLSGGLVAEAAAGFGSLTAGAASAFAGDAAFQATRIAAFKLTGGMAGQSEVNWTELSLAPVLGMWGAELGVVSSGLYSASRGAAATTVASDAVSIFANASLANSSGLAAKEAGAVADAGATIQSASHSMADISLAQAKEQTLLRGSDLDLSQGGDVGGLIESEQLTGAAAVQAVEGKYVSNIKPRSNMEVYGQALVRTEDDILPILIKAGFSKEDWDGYHFRILTPEEYSGRAATMGTNFDASYGPPIYAPDQMIKFHGDIASKTIHGEVRIPIYINPEIMGSDEWIVQALSHEWSEVEDLRWELPLKGSRYDELITAETGTGRKNLHVQAVEFGDQSLMQFRNFLNDSNNP